MLLNAVLFCHIRKAHVCITQKYPQSTCISVMPERKIISPYLSHILTSGPFERMLSTFTVIWNLRTARKRSCWDHCHESILSIFLFDLSSLLNSYSEHFYLVEVVFWVVAMKGYNKTAYESVDYILWMLLFIIW